MGKILKVLPAKLVIGLISKETPLFERIQKILSSKFGKIDIKSQIFDFDKTDYYEKEMGENLKRLFLSFERLIPAEQLVKIKLLTNKIETKISKNPDKRGINIDPGYISLPKLVLATTKSFIHRIYLGHGIFEEITLYFKGNSFQPGPWTYPDFRSQSHIDFFNEVRARYYNQLEKKYGSSQLYKCV